MSYVVKAAWRHEQETEYEKLGDATQAAADLLRLHPDATVWLNGEGIGLNVWLDKEAVRV